MSDDGVVVIVGVIGVVDVLVVCIGVWYVCVVGWWAVCSPVERAWRAACVGALCESRVRVSAVCVPVFHGSLSERVLSRPDRAGVRAFLTFA